MEPSAAKRLRHIVRVVYYMIRKGISKQKLMMDLHLLLKRGKALLNLMTFHHHGGGAAGSSGAYYSGFSCLSFDPNMSFYSPRGREVEFSCSNTPSFPSFHTATKRKNRQSHHHSDNHKYDAAVIAKAFEILNSEISDADSVVPSPSPAPVWLFGKSPMKVRPLRITDSPFPIWEEEGEADGRIDREADEFIRRFHEQLRLQQRVDATPDYTYRREQLLGKA